MNVSDWCLYVGVFAIAACVVLELAHLLLDDWFDTASYVLWWLAAACGVVSLISLLIGMCAALLEGTP